MTFLWNAIPTYLFNRPYHYLRYISFEIAICCIFMLGQKGQIFFKSYSFFRRITRIDSYFSKWILLTKHFKLRSEKLHFCKCWKSVTSTEQMNHSVSWKSNLQLLNCWTTLIHTLHHSFKKTIHGVKRRAQRSYFLWKYFLKLPSHGYIPAVWNLWSDLNFVAVCTQLVLDDLRNTP